MQKALVQVPAWHKPGGSEDTPVMEAPRFKASLGYNEPLFQIKEEETGRGQWVKALVAKSGSLDLIPRTDVREEN